MTWTLSLKYLSVEPPLSMKTTYDVERTLIILVLVLVIVIVIVVVIVIVIDFK